MACRQSASYSEKTKRPAIIPLNEMAQSLLPPRTDDNPESLVFHLVKKSDNVSKYVRRLKEKAGIEKGFDLPLLTAYDSIVGYLSRSRYICSEGCFGTWKHNFNRSLCKSGS